MKIDAFLGFSPISIIRIIRLGAGFDQPPQLQSDVDPLLDGVCWCSWVLTTSEQPNLNDRTIENEVSAHTHFHIVD